MTKDDVQALKGPLIEEGLDLADLIRKKARHQDNVEKNKGQQKSPNPENDPFEKKGPHDQGKGCNKIIPLFMMRIFSAANAYTVPLFSHKTNVQ